jgi:hypothetical protein
MVHILDEGSHFDAPIETIWKYLNTPEEHGPAHKNRRNVQVKPAGEHAIVISQEQEMGGQWHKVSSKITMYPPVGVVIETTEGPLAGSKLMTFYTPNGDKTGVTVVGDFMSKSVPDAQLRPMVLGFLESVYNEDNTEIKKLAAKK